MNRLIKCVLINLLYVVVFAFAGSVHATVRVLNNGGGTNSSNALEVTIADSTQMQIKRLGSGQLYQPGTYPSGSYPYNSLLDNGVYIRYNNRIYGANHFSYSAATIYNSFSISSVQPGSTSQGVTQSTTSSLSLTSSILSSPTVSIAWKYTYPLDYITAEVTLTIPATATVSTNNPIRYYHAVDTYLGGNDNGCGVRYTDANGKLVVGTYPLTNGTCPSSSSLPPNLDVVESFRERSGKFDHHCVGYWSDFWSTATSSPPACSISKSGSLGDSVTTTYQDTGAAIEYDFTAPGIYTFSYDFVVGSTFVPNYDHFEIRHAGTATLCPTEVKVLACLSSTVPCPDNQLVSSGELKGSLTVSPTTPTVTDTPDPFTLGSSQSIGTVTMQGSAAATYTLGVSGLTKTPLSGVKCWNTATSSQSCSFTFTNTPCLNSFECIESGLTYNNLSGVTNKRNPIYTKLAGRAFDLDVYALLTSGIQAAGYVSAANGVTVELVNDTGNACGATVVASKKISFASTNAGKQTVSFSNTDVPNSYPSLRCRVTDTSLSKSGCSTDNFSVRPQVFTVTSSNATPPSPAGPTSTPVLVAGTGLFNLKAVTGESNYSGTPQAIPVAHSGATVAGVLSYVDGNNKTITGSLPAAIGGTSTLDSFRYSEVGLFQFAAANGVYDDTFTAVDKLNGDCNMTAGLEADNLGGSTGPKFYGCRIGNAVSSYFGRFIPQRFEITTGTVTKACGAFAYCGQDTTIKAALEVPFTITATNGLGATTQNYVGSYAKFDPAVWPNFNFTTNPPLTTVALTRSTATNSLIGSWAAGAAAMNAKFYVPRSNIPINEQIVTVRTQIQDTDGVTTTTSPFAIADTVPFRYGRLAIPPVHGSELLPLTVLLEAQFWGGTGYRRSTDDSCTTFDIKTIAMRNYRGNLNACETVLSGSTPIIQGKASLRLSAPGVSGNTPNTGSVDLGINFGSITAGDQTCVGPGTVQSNAIDGTAGMAGWFGANPVGRATFGVYKAPIIYMRENF